MSNIYSYDIEYVIKKWFEACVCSDETDRLEVELKRLINDNVEIRLSEINKEENEEA